MRAVTPQSFNGLAVLIVDGESAVRHDIKATVEGLGARLAVAAADADAAVGWLGTLGSTIDVVICGVELADNGTSAIIHALWERQRRPRIILTAGHAGADFQASAALASRLGLVVIGKVTTPVTSTELENILRAPLGADAVSGIVSRFAHDAAGLVLTTGMLSELLLEDPSLSPTHADHVRHIHRASQELSQLIKELREHVAPKA